MSAVDMAPVFTTTGTRPRAARTAARGYPAPLAAVEREEFALAGKHEQPVGPALHQEVNEFSQGAQVHTPGCASSA